MDGAPVFDEPGGVTGWASVLLKWSVRGADSRGPGSLGDTALLSSGLMFEGRAWLHPGRKVVVRHAMVEHQGSYLQGKKMESAMISVSSMTEDGWTRER